MSSFAVRLLCSDIHLSFTCPVIPWASFVSHFVAADSVGQAGYWGLVGGNVPPGAPGEAAATDLTSDQTSPVFSIESITHDS